MFIKNKALTITVIFLLTLCMTSSVFREDAAKADGMHNIAGYLNSIGEISNVTKKIPEDYQLPADPRFVDEYGDISEESVRELQDTLFPLDTFLFNKDLKDNYSKYWDEVALNYKDKYVYKYQLYYTSLWHFDLRSYPATLGVETMYDPNAYLSPVKVIIAFSDTSPYAPTDISAGLMYLTIKKYLLELLLRTDIVYREGKYIPKFPQYSEENLVSSFLNNKGLYYEKHMAKIVTKNEQNYISLEDLVNTFGSKLVYSDDKKKVSFKYRDALITYELHNQNFEVATKDGVVYCEPSLNSFDFWLSINKRITLCPGFKMFKSGEVLPLTLTVTKESLGKVYPEYIDDNFYVPMGMIQIFNSTGAWYNNNGLYFSRPPFNILYIDNTNTLSFKDQHPQFFFSQNKVIK